MLRLNVIITSPNIISKPNEGYQVDVIENFVDAACFEIYLGFNVLVVKSLLNIIPIKLLYKMRLTRHCRKGPPQRQDSSAD